MLYSENYYVNREEEMNSVEAEPILSFDEFSYQQCTFGEKDFFSFSKAEEDYLINEDTRENTPENEDDAAQVDSLESYPQFVQENTIPIESRNDSDEKKSKSNVVDSERIKNKDGIYKKFKTHFFKWVINKFSKILRKNKEKLQIKDIKKLKLRPLPNTSFTSNVCIDFNRLTIKMKMKDIYTKPWGELDENGMHINLRERENFKNNNELLFFISHHEITALNEFLNETLEFNFRVYLDTQFHRDKQIVREKQCNEECLKGNCEKCHAYIKKFEDVIEGRNKEIGILNDFLFSKGNKKRNASRNLSMPKKSKKFKITKV